MNKIYANIKAAYLAGKAPELYLVDELDSTWVRDAETHAGLGSFPTRAVAQHAVTKARAKAAKFIN